MKKIILLICLIVPSIVIISFYFIDRATKTDTKNAFDNATLWELKPSFKYDTLCFLNALVGDEYYLRFYQEDYNRFSTKFTPEVTLALQELKKQKDNYKVILGAWLCNIYSVTDDEWLDDMIVTLDNDSEIWDRYKGTEDEKRAFEAYAKNNLKVIFSFLKENNFESYWKEKILPRANERIAELKKSELKDYNIVPEIEKHIGSKLSSNKITVYLLYFAQPHGIRIQGTNFITDISYPFNTVVGNAIHEMFHPPFGKDNSTFNSARDSLKEDKLIQAKMASQNETHGYSTYESYFEENCVDALEVLVREKFKLLDEGAKDYFNNHDGGVDALGVALYSLIKVDDYIAKGESFEKFFIRMVKTEKLAPGKVKELNDDFFK